MFIIKLYIILHHFLSSMPCIYFPCFMVWMLLGFHYFQFSSLFSFSLFRPFPLSSNTASIIRNHLHLSGEVLSGVKGWIVEYPLKITYIPEDDKTLDKLTSDWERRMTHRQKTCWKAHGTDKKPSAGAHISLQSSIITCNQIRRVEND